MSNPKAPAKQKPEQVSADDALARHIVARWTRMDSDASYWLSMWQQLSYYVMPRKSYILTRTLGPTMDRETNLFDTTAVRANEVMAAGVMSYIHDAGSDWLSITAQERKDTPPSVEQYYAECSKIILAALARSNFYTVAHEMHLDRGAFGTAVMYVEEGSEAPLNFRTFNVGTFRVSDNFDGLVDTIFIKREMSVRQLVEEFGEENVSETTRKRYQQPDGSGMEDKVEVIQGIYPRPEKEREKGKLDPKNKPIASVYVEYASKKVLRNSGYDEQPFFCVRWEKWQNASYGWSPAWVAYPDAKQLNFLQKQMDALAELAAFPRVLAPESLSSEIDLRAGGITYFNTSDPGAVPREWATSGRYDIGQDRIKEKQRHIEEAFNVPLFQMFAQEDMQVGGQAAITATQVRAMESEKLTMLSPSYALLTTELLIPLIRRVYGILARQGAFPEPPKELIQVAMNGEPYLPEPKVIFNNRMSIAVANRGADAIDTVVQQSMAVAQATGDPSHLDIYDFDEIARTKAIVNGADPEFLRNPDEVDRIRQARAQQQARQAQMEQEQHMADIAQKVGTVKPDSVAAGHVGRHLRAVE